jgi:hypothetical protein
MAAGLPERLCAQDLMGFLIAAGAATLKIRLDVDT